MDQKLLVSIESKKRELDKYRPLNPAIVQKLREQFALEWTYNSNAIEGNTLTLHETEIVLTHGITIGGKSVNEHLEAINHREGIVYIEQMIQKKVEISEEVIKKLHYLVLKSINDEEAGYYRRHNVRIVGAHLIPAQAIKIADKMEMLIAWYQANKYQIPVALLAAQMHYRLVCIHPFIDGNGRVSRLLMNMILMAYGYPPAIILHVDRRKYYRVLNEANMGNETPFENFIGRAIERSLIIYLQSAKPDLSAREGLISLKEAAAYCPYSPEYLAFLARSGKISAVKMNKTWVTTREAVEEYSLLQTRKREPSSC